MHSSYSTVDESPRPHPAIIAHLRTSSPYPGTAWDSSFSTSVRNSDKVPKNPCGCIFFCFLRPGERAGNPCPHILIKFSCTGSNPVRFFHLSRACLWPSLKCGLLRRCRHQSLDIISPDSSSVGFEPTKGHSCRRSFLNIFDIYFVSRNFSIFHITLFFYWEYWNVNELDIFASGEFHE